MAENPYHIEIKDYSPEVLKAFEGAIEKALTEIGLNIRDVASEYAPADTGRLAGSMDFRVDMSEPSVTIGTPVEYAPYVEFGTGKYYPGGRPTPWTYQDAKGQWHLTHGQRAKPFLKTAVEDYKSEIKDTIKEALENA